MTKPSNEELYEWLLNKIAELSLEKPEFPFDRRFLLYGYEQLVRLMTLAENDYFNGDKEQSFLSALRKELIRLEDIPFTDDGEREETVETDIRMLTRATDLIWEFDRFIERTGGFK